MAPLEFLLIEVYVHRRAGSVEQGGNQCQVNGFLEETQWDYCKEAGVAALLWRALGRGRAPHTSLQEAKDKKSNDDGCQLKVRGVVHDGSLTIRGLVSLTHHKGPIVETWDKVTKAIQDATEEAFAASPPFDPSLPSTFQTYWRNVFNRLRNSVSADPSIPRHLTDRAVLKFTITLFDQEPAIGSTLSHSYSEPIVLKNNDGVQKEDLVNGLIDKLYGDTLPKVFIEQDLWGDRDEAIVGKCADDKEPRYFKDETGVVIYKSLWKSVRENADGNRIAYLHEDDMPNVVFLLL
ncbi:hypothetical protein NM208_g9873 [Fusarium decemcellulare]|uniref:Uncharacterized protein n=1 Tax=Fusarium decemcellulare TaxID=57161 RepID=A0ACC1RZZ9_9HYPO|nr:hypothetical protein NM208_g9873 [Fusarium decemcellulare]